MKPARVLPHPKRECVSWVRYTHRAREDLLDIWVHIALRNPAAADGLYDRIEENCRLLRDHPRLGAVRKEIAADARVLVIEHWLVLYRLVEGGVQIVRIVDGARDLAHLEWPPE
jgi:toxin ParE1/3/4